MGERSVGVSRGRWAKIGKQLRAHRERAGLSQTDLARRVLLSPAMLSAMERGARGIKREHLERIDRELDTGNALANLWDRTSESALPTWYQDAAKRERASTEIWEYHPLLVPGLLQTEAYAGCLLTMGLPRESPAEISELLQARMDRKAILKSERPPFLLVVLDGSVLSRPVGGKKVMHEQLGHLLDLGERPNISLQVIPFETERHPGLFHAFSLFMVPNQGTVLYTETRHSGTPTDDPGIVADYARHYGDLRGAALPQEASLQLIAQAQQEFS
ncbi:helix-turn-helix transcriptional regulator [Thermobifida halotolerans]|uniref:Helix-turn-helix transcriptional regulator n=1 Tax=Thermobifida halotolerans TaxID=483545 RepID=A0AA97M6D2_9ACTN|nr:helix-turn-helix transcriptional regulator [Thermobifida halotolerans]